ncbi:MAG: DNA-protecting protein DprA, partial [Lachnospiraceae bacterium]|nr:DNA-protecting protein DprA [Lachnospiraceae bacterium]
GLHFGCLISEYYPGDKALPYNFPQRNRIISGLCDILLVVEAGKKSGTFITVDHALEQGREIFAIPGRIGDTVSDGCNSLIKNGAMMATEPEDIIEELKAKYTMLLTAEKSRKKGKKTELPDDEKKIYENLDVVPTQINEIAERTGIDPGTLGQLLIGMELKGLIKEVGKNLYIKQ